MMKLFRVGLGRVQTDRHQLLLEAVEARFEIGPFWMVGSNVGSRGPIFTDWHGGEDKTDCF